MSRFKIKSALTAGLLAALAVPSAFGFGVGLQPTTVEMEFEPGDLRRQVVNIANVHTEKTISLTLGLADWALDESGQIKLSPPGDTESSAAEWVRFSPAYITLKPGESEQIVVDMSAPVRLSREGDYRFALLASTILPEQRAGGSGVWKKYQIASLFYMTTGAASSEPKIVSSGVTIDEAGNAFVGMRIENDGNAHARLEGAVEISITGEEPRSVPISSLVVLDKAARNYVLPIGEAVPADASIKVNLQNIFAPQTESGVVPLPAHMVGAADGAIVRKAAIELESVEPAVDAATEAPATDEVTEALADPVLTPPAPINEPS